MFHISFRDKRKYYIYTSMVLRPLLAVLMIAFFSYNLSSMPGSPCSCSMCTDVYVCVRPDGKNMSLPHVSLSISQHMGFCCDNLRNYYGFTSHGGVLTVPRKNYICSQQHNKSSALCEIT